MIERFFFYHSTSSLGSVYIFSAYLIFIILNLFFLYIFLGGVWDTLSCTQVLVTPGSAQ